MSLQKHVGGKNCLLYATKSSLKSHVWYRVILTSLLQGHHHGLLNKVPLNEVPEVVPVHSEVWQLESAQGRVQKRLIAATAGARDVRAGQRNDGRASMRNTPRQTLLCSYRERERKKKVLHEVHICTL